MIVVTMGVCGSGKTSVGEMIASRMGWAFIEGDDLHPAANRERMASGMPLTDDDRWPWLDCIADRMRVVDEVGLPVEADHHEQEADTDEEGDSPLVRRGSELGDRIGHDGIVCHFTAL